MMFQKKVQPISGGVSGGGASESNNVRHKSMSRPRTERLAPFYAAAKADLFGEHDYTLISPVPSAILISDENDTVGSRLLGYRGDNILRSLVFQIWFPALLFQVLCVPVGMLVLTEKIPSTMALLTIPGCVSPMLLLLRSHWQVMKTALNTWESVFLAVYSVGFCTSITILLQLDYRTVFIWTVIFPALISSTFADASSVRLDHGFIKGTWNMSLLGLPPYLISLAFVFTIMAMLNTRDNALNFYDKALVLESPLIQTNIRYSMTALSMGMTISLFLGKSIVLMIRSPDRCTALRAPMTIDVATLKPPDEDEVRTGRRGRHVLEVRLSGQFPLKERAKVVYRQQSFRQSVQNITKLPQKPLKLALTRGVNPDVLRKNLKDQEVADGIVSEMSAHSPHESVRSPNAFATLRKFASRRASALLISRKGTGRGLPSSVNSSLHEAPPLSAIPEQSRVDGASDHHNKSVGRKLSGSASVATLHQRPTAFDKKTLGVSGSLGSLHHIGPFGGGGAATVESLRHQQQPHVGLGVSGSVSSLPFPRPLHPSASAQAFNHNQLVNSASNTFLMHHAAGGVGGKNAVKTMDNSGSMASLHRNGVVVVGPQQQQQHPGGGRLRGTDSTASLHGGRNNVIGASNSMASLHSGGKTLNKSGSYASLHRNKNYARRSSNGPSFLFRQQMSLLHQQFQGDGAGVGDFGASDDASSLLLRGEGAAAAADPQQHEPSELFTTWGGGEGHFAAGMIKEEDGDAVELRASGSAPMLAIALANSNNRGMVLHENLPRTQQHSNVAEGDTYTGISGPDSNNNSTAARGAPRSGGPMGGGGGGGGLLPTLLEETGGDSNPGTPTSRRSRNRVISSSRDLASKKSVAVLLPTIATEQGQETTAPTERIPREREPVEDADATAAAALTPATEAAAAAGTKSNQNSGNSNTIVNFLRRASAILYNPNASNSAGLNRSFDISPNPVNCKFTIQFANHLDDDSDDDEEEEGKEREEEGQMSGTGGGNMEDGYPTNEFAAMQLLQQQQDIDAYYQEVLGGGYGEVGGGGMGHTELGLLAGGAPGGGVAQYDPQILQMYVDAISAQTGAHEVTMPHNSITPQHRY